MTQFASRKAKVYPKKFEEIKTQCIMNAPAPNVCEPEAINKFKSCSMVKAMPMVAEMKKLYKDKKPQLAALFQKLAVSVVGVKAWLHFVFSSLNSKLAFPSTKPCRREHGSNDFDLFSFAKFC